MAIPAIPQVTNPTEEKETNQSPAQHCRKALGVTKKMGELMVVLQETLRLESERQRRDDGRVRAILNAATGGAIERLVRSMSLSEADKTFLRERGWRV